MARARDIANIINIAPSIYATEDEAVLKSLVDAKGDLLAGTADNTAGRLAVGTNGQVLIADSSQSTGLNWANESGKPGVWTTYTPILSQTVTVSTSTTTGRYVRFGSLVIVRVRLIASSSGTAGGIITVSLPITASPAYSVFGISGSGIIFKAATNVQHHVALHNAASTVAFVSDISGGGNFGQQSSFQLVSGDYVSFTTMYEVAP
jgi:hypothetical protein